MTIRVIIGQLNDLDDETAAFARHLGIDGVQFNTPRLPTDEGIWQLDDLVVLRRRCADAGLRLEALENVPMSFYDKVLTGAPGRERQLEKTSGEPCATSPRPGFLSSVTTSCRPSSGVRPWSPAGAGHW